MKVWRCGFVRDGSSVGAESIGRPSDVHAVRALIADRSRVRPEAPASEAVVAVAASLVP